MNIERDEIWLCSDCTYVACNGESGGVFADIEATRKGLADLQTDGRHLAPNFDSNPDDKDDFSETHNIDMAYARACNGTCADCGMTPDECTEKRCPYHESGIREFSSTQCAACKTNLAGYRARFCTLTESIDRDKLDEFTRAYITCALWSSMDESDESGGDPLDKNYDLSDIEEQTLRKMVEDCAKFQAENIGNIHGCYRKPLRSYIQFPEFESDNAMAGHDFWLTRNGHGSGFWDGDWPEPQATELTKASKEFGEFTLYVGDDKKIYS